MTFTVNWTVTGDTGSGSFNWSGQETAPAFDRVQAMIPAGATRTLALQPGGGATLRFFAIAASRYGEASFAVDGQPAQALAGPVVMSGDAVRLLGAAAPQNLTVANAGADDLLVDVAIYRDA